MRLEQSFSLALTPDDAHALLLDLERVTPCLPGAQITGRTDERHYHAEMAVRIGPIRMSYRGGIEIVEVDRTARAAILRAEAKDARGRGSARADMHMTVSPHGEGSQVQVRTDLDLTGRVAQMGRGVVQDVATDLMDQFAAGLARVAGAGPALPAVASVREGGGAGPPGRPEARHTPGLSPRDESLRAVDTFEQPTPIDTPRTPLASASQSAAADSAKAPNAFAILWRVLLRRLRGASSGGAAEGQPR